MPHQLNSHFVKGLEGTWIGGGAGVYPPRVESFEYEELLTIKPTAKPQVWELRSATKNAKSGKPMHVESGFIRAPPNGEIELVVSHPFGLCEISSGSCHSGKKVELHATGNSLTRVKTAGSPYTTGIRRTYELSDDGDVLKFRMDMATNEHQGLQNHLTSELRRQREA
jgi:hypothetical protein